MAGVRPWLQRLEDTLWIWGSSSACWLGKKRRLSGSYLTSPHTLFSSVSGTFRGLHVLDIAGFLSSCSSVKEEPVYTTCSGPSGSLPILRFSG